MTSYQKLKMKYDALMELLDKLHEQAYHMANYAAEEIKNDSFYQDANDVEIVQNEWRIVLMSTTRTYKTLGYIDKQKD